MARGEYPGTKSAVLDQPTLIEWYLQYLADKVWLSFAVNKRVVPGQPILVSWRIWAFTDQYDLGTGYRVRVLFENQELLHAPDDQTQFLPYVHPGDSGRVAKSIAALPPDNDLGVELYTIGPKTFTIEVTTNGKDAGPFTATASFDVVYEAVDRSWWVWPQWQQPYQTLGPLGSTQSGPNLLWKQSYNVDGQLFNHSQYVKMHAEVRLDQLEVVVGSSVVSRQYPGHDIDKQRKPSVVPSATFDLDEQISQQWSWLNQGTWYDTGPNDKQIIYTANITLTDAYENVYPEFASIPITFFFTVSSDKVYYAEGAFAAWLISVAFSWFPWVGKPAGILAGVLGSQALDPLPPDPAFLKVADRVTTLLLPAKHDQPDFAVVRQFFETVARIVDATRTLTVTDARLRGARAAQSAEGIKLQTATYHELLQQMLADARRLSALTEDSVRALNTKEVSKKVDKAVSKSALAKAAKKVKGKKERATLVKQASSLFRKGPRSAFRLLTIALVDGVNAIAEQQPEAPRSI